MDLEHFQNLNNVSAVNKPYLRDSRNACVIVGTLIADETVVIYKLFLNDFNSLTFHTPLYGRGYGCISLKIRVAAYLEKKKK